MNYKEALLTIKSMYGMKPRKSILVRGKHGIGKSSMVYQAAALLSKQFKEPFGIIDIRLGQFEVGDLIGLPKDCPTYEIEQTIFENGEITTRLCTIENVTTHDLPQWFPRDPKYKGFLFFDEINRGTKDTRQWAFQIVLDYKTNFKSVPEGIQIVAACNDNINKYQIGELDQSFLDRFFVIDLSPTIPEFMEHADLIGLHPAVRMFLEKNGPRYLDPPDDFDADTRYPSRRSWVALSDTIKHFANGGIDILNPHATIEEKSHYLQIAAGWVGLLVGADFQRFVEVEYKVFTAEQILNEWQKCKKELQGLHVPDYANYCDLIVKYAEDHKQLTKSQEKNLYEFFIILPHEVASTFWNNFRAKNDGVSEHWYRSQNYKEKNGTERSPVREYLCRDLIGGIRGLEATRAAAETAEATTAPEATEE
jgi:hypothetical protein